MNTDEDRIEESILEPVAKLNFVPRFRLKFRDASIATVNFATGS
jgi:hypothetical protein